MKKKPDKFTRMTLDAMKKLDRPGDVCISLVGFEIAGLLRQYHSEVVELVKKELAEAIEERRMDSFELLLKKLKEFTK